MSTRVDAQTPPEAPPRGQPRAGEARARRPLISALGPLPADALADALAAAADVTLLVDDDGVVRGVAAGGAGLGELGVADWLDRRWADLVLPENRAKIEAMLAGESPGRWRQVNHPSPTGDVPVSYLAVPMTGERRLLVVGRDMRAAAALQQRLLRAQQAMEREGLRLRQMEQRYRLLFETGGEAVLVVDTATRRIVEANPAARRLAGLAVARLEGQPFTALVAPEDRESAVALLGAAAATEQRHPARLRLVGGTQCMASMALFRHDRGTCLMIRLAATGPAGPVAGGGAPPLAEIIDRIPDAFVLLDADLAIVAANQLFLDLVQALRSDAVLGQPLDRFIGRPGIDRALLAAQLAEHGAVRNFGTVVRGPGGLEEDVEISALSARDAGELRHGLLVRRVSRTLVATPAGQPLPRSVEQLTELVGRVSLKEIVRESTDLIERLCIEAALSYTADNRASAAEILGLSRQSLYSKLHRHGLGNLVPDSE